MWIVFGSQTDFAAQWVARGLTQHGLRPVEWVAAESLPHAVHWIHSVGESDVSVEFQLDDGRRIHSHHVLGVVNRIRSVPDGHLWGSCPDERSYVRQEMTSFYLSWLNAFTGPVLNPARPQGMAGAVRHPSEWCLLAARAGLTCPPYCLSSRESPESGWRPSAGLSRAFTQAPQARLYVVGREVLCAGQPRPLPTEVHAGCTRLAELAESPLLGIDLAQSPSGAWLFLSADAHPELTGGGDPLLASLVRFFRNGVTGGPGE